MKNFWKLLILTVFLCVLPDLSHADDPPDPIEHFEIQDPADLTKGGASEAYRGLAAQMLEGYSQSGVPTAAQYQEWQRFNSAPYLSRGHGNRFLNNYGNAIARDYLDLEFGDEMPMGSIIAKDSFTVTKTGEIFAGALFLMEKLPRGTDPETADWRYTMIMPDGSLFGDTLGDESAKMDFCHSCHEIAEADDYLYFIPEEYRVDTAQ